MTLSVQANAIEQFKELLNIAGVDKEPLQTNMPSAMEHSDHGSLLTDYLWIHTLILRQVSFMHCFAVFKFFSVIIT